MDDREYYPDPKRMKLSDMSPNFGGSQPCICPPPRKGLPQEQSSAAWDGRVENVRAWLKSGGNINAVNQYGGTLLSAACCNGQAEVMRELMLHPDLHLNTVHGGKTALAQAIHYGHTGCAEMILTSSLKNEEPMLWSSSFIHGLCETKISLYYTAAVNRKDIV